MMMMILNLIVIQRIDYFILSFLVKMLVHFIDKKNSF